MPDMSWRRVSRVFGSVRHENGYPKSPQQSAPDPSAPLAPQAWADRARGAAYRRAALRGDAMNAHRTDKMEGRATRPARRSLMSRYAKPEHKKAAKVLGYALTLETPDAWYGASIVWQARMTPQEAAATAWAALHATEPELAQMVATAALGGAGAPLPTMEDVMADAGW